jgi:lysozyme family protein
LKKPFTKRAGGVAQGVGLEFKPQYHKKEKKITVPSDWWFKITKNHHLKENSYVHCSTIHNNQDVSATEVSCSG